MDGEDKMAGREKYWSELGIEEKLERMRGVVKRLQMEQRETHNILQKLTGHRHLGSDLMVDFHQGLGGIMETPFPSLRHALHGEEEWF